MNQSSDGSAIGLVFVAVIVWMVFMAFFGSWHYVRGAETVAPIPATQSCELWVQRHNTPPTYPNE